AGPNPPQPAPALPVLPQLLADPGDVLLAEQVAAAEDVVADLVGRLPGQRVDQQPVGQRAGLVVRQPGAAGPVPDPGAGAPVQAQRVPVVGDLKAPSGRA